MDRWEGKVAVVTGVSSGIGASIAAHLVELGMKVVGMARRVQLVEELAEGLNSRPGHRGKLYPLKADVSSEEDVVEAFQWIRDNLGAVHVLVNNAGCAPFGLISNLQREDYKRVRACMDTNVMGLLMCSNEALRLMRETGVEDGHIVNINSISGHYIMAKPGLYAYSASKHAVTVISEGLRRELAGADTMIRVTDIGPGMVNTNIAEASGIPKAEKYISMLPKLETEDVTRSVIHAISAPPSVQIAELIIRPVGEKF